VLLREDVRKSNLFVHPFVTHLFMLDFVLVLKMNIILLFLEYPGSEPEPRLPLMLSCAQDLAQAT
jgi:hypothetical protein